MSENEKSVLVLGGTGAMGTSLVEDLAQKGWKVFVTSRSDHEQTDRNIIFIKGNAKENDCLRTLLKQKYDVIVDFMVYKTEEFKERFNMLLNATDQYIYTSTARVYAESSSPLTEESPRLLDVCTDQEFLATDEYALAKARQENFLYDSVRSNFTIIRPSITYNKNRLQLVISEKEEWLQRALNGKSVVLPKDAMGVHTAMAYGNDVAGAISALVGNERALGETVHIACPESITWNTVLGIYQSVFEEKLGHRMKICYVPNAVEAGSILRRKYQIQYARAIDRSFNCEKLNSLTCGSNFISPQEGLKICLSEFLDHPQFNKKISWRACAYFDGVAKEHTNLKEFKGKGKLKYMCGRQFPFLLKR